MAEKLIIDWKEYNLTTEKLAIQIYQSGFKPDILIGIMRGGAPIIDVLSRIFKLKCAYLAVESYSGKGIEDQLTPTHAHDPSRKHSVFHSSQLTSCFLPHSHEGRFLACKI